MNNLIFLPGLDKQVNYAINHLDLSGKLILIIGANSEEIARIIQKKFNSGINIIVDNYDSLINSRVILSSEKNISVKLMDFKHTDFNNETFDFIYAQASISTSSRNKIVKEIRRILKPEGFFCAGENVSLKDNAPVFIKDIWKNSDILPINSNELKNYYTDRHFEIIDEIDLSKSLKDFYYLSVDLLKDHLNKLPENEKSYYKKVLNKISHESNAYLKLGGDEFMGFKMLILKKLK